MLYYTILYYNILYYTILYYNIIRVGLRRSVDWYRRAAVELRPAHLSGEGPGGGGFPASRCSLYYLVLSGSGLLGFVVRGCTWFAARSRLHHQGFYCRS